MRRPSALPTGPALVRRVALASLMVACGSNPTPPQAPPPQANQDSGTVKDAIADVTTNDATADVAVFDATGDGPIPPQPPPQPPQPPQPPPQPPMPQP